MKRALAIALGLTSLTVLALARSRAAAGSASPSPVLRPIPIDAHQAADFTVTYEPEIVQYIMAPRPGDPIPVTVHAVRPAEGARPRTVLNWSGLLVWESSDGSFGVVTGPTGVSDEPQLQGKLMARRSGR